MRDDSPAALAGLQKGDVIKEADRQEVASVDDIERALSKARNDNAILLLIARGNETLFVELQTR